MLLLLLVRRLVVPLAVLAALAVGVDRVAVKAAESVLAGQLQTSGGFDAKPEVTIEGFPFLTQAFRGEYDAIDVKAGASTRGKVRVDSLHADVRRPQVDLEDALRGDVTRIPVSGLTATAVVTYLDLAKAAGVAGVAITPAPGGVSVVGTLKVLGQTVRATATSDVSLQGDVIVVKARSVSVQGGSTTLLRAVSGLLDLRVRVGALPYGLALTGVKATSTGVELSAEAGATVLRP